MSMRIRITAGPKTYRNGPNNSSVRIKLQNALPADLSFPLAMSSSDLFRRPLVAVPPCIRGLGRRRLARSGFRSILGSVHRCVKGFHDLCFDRRIEIVAEQIALAGLLEEGLAADAALF